MLNNNTILQNETQERKIEKHKVLTANGKGLTEKDPIEKI